MLRMRVLLLLCPYGNKMAVEFMRLFRLHSDTVVVLIDTTLVQ